MTGLVQKLWQCQIKTNHWNYQVGGVSMAGSDSTCSTRLAHQPANPSPGSHLHISYSFLGQIGGIWLDWILPSYQGAGDWLTYHARHLRIAIKRLHLFLRYISLRFFSVKDFLCFSEKVCNTTVIKHTITWKLKKNLSKKGSFLPKSPK